MDIDRTTLLYFSPTHTTRKIVEAIARGIGAAESDRIDLTPPSGTWQPAAVIGGLAIIGAPVYGGRLPAEAISRLRRISGNGTPAVIVAVYGNRAYEDALLELRDVAREIGFAPIAAGAFIGEHSYSGAATPIAAGRPDAADLQLAEEFGTAAREKLRRLGPAAEWPLLPVPGTFPYKEWPGLAGIAPLTREASCVRCGVCVAACPTAAITLGETVTTDAERCIKCCACVKSCAPAARLMDNPRLQQVAEMLSANCRERKEPETFL